MMNRTAKITTGITVAVVAVGLLALTAPVVVPFLPHRVQEALTGPVGPIETVPGTVDDLFRANGLDEHEPLDSHVSHADVEALYVASAKVWPWSLPADFKFPGRRGVADTPGSHLRNMGLASAFSKWATASLDSVRAGDYEPGAADALLDEVEAAYRILFDADVLGDSRFIENAVDPLRTDYAGA